MPKICVVDTYYAPAIEAFPVQFGSTNADELQRILELSFSTSDHYSRGLRAHGWECIDIVANHPGLQQLWAREHGLRNATLNEIALNQIEELKPDVLFLQDASFFSQVVLEALGKRYCLAAQISCPMPREENVKQFDVIFTSFPHYLPRFRAMGVRGVFNPLGFDEVVLGRMGPISDFLDCVFVGGVGARSHWKYGTEVLEHVAAEIGEQFRWYGYGVENLSADSPLRKCYRGEAWGLDAYRRMSQAMIVINRHGEVAQGYANNQRLFEATGCGALLITEAAPNLRDYFTDQECVSYSSPADAVKKIRHYLDHPDEARQIAEAGQRRTLHDHTYHSRMGTISATLKEML